MAKTRELNRAKIQAVSKANTSPTAIAASLGVSRSTVYRWKDKTTVEDKVRPGRPTKLSPNSKATTTSRMKQVLGASLRQTTLALNTSPSYLQRGNTIGRETTQVCCGHRLGPNCLPTTHLCVIETKLSKKNIADRLAFALRLKEMGFCDPGRRGQDIRANIVWTDESPILINGIPNRQNTRYRTADKSKIPVIKVAKCEPKIMVAGGMTASGVTELHIVEEKAKVNGSYYLTKILPIYIAASDNKDLVPKKNKAILMEDGAPAHKAKPVRTVVNATYQQAWGPGVWPGNSPDLNVLENLWSVLKEEVKKEPHPQDRNELIEKVKQIWNSFSRDYLTKLVESFPKRIQEVNDRHGGMTDY